MTLSCGVIYARPKLRARTREPTQRQWLVIGAPNFLRAIKPLQIRLKVSVTLTIREKFNWTCGYVSVGQRGLS